MLVRTLKRNTWLPSNITVHTVGVGKMGTIHNSMCDLDIEISICSVMVKQIKIPDK